MPPRKKGKGKRYRLIEYLEQIWRLLIQIWWPFRASIVLGIILFILGLIPLSDVSVQIELTVRNLSFDLQENQSGPFFSALPVKTARFTHFERFVIPFDTAEVPTQFDENTFSPSGWTTVGVHDTVTVTPGESLSSIIFEDVTINELNLQRGARVTLTMNDQTIKMEVDEAMIDGGLNIGDMLMIECHYCRFGSLVKSGEIALQHLRFLNATAGKMLSFRVGDGLSIIDLDLFPKSEHAETNVYIKSPAFVEGRLGALHSSLTKPGRAIIKEFDNKEIQIFPTDFVEIDSSSIVEITSMIFKNNEIELVLAGEVDELRTGNAGHLYSRLPTWLGWFGHKFGKVLQQLRN